MAPYERKFGPGEATEMARDELLNLDTRDSGNGLSNTQKQYLEGADPGKIFREKICAQLRIHGYSGDLSDTKEMLNYLVKCRDQAQVPDLSRPTLKNWLEKGAHNKSKETRKKIFQLCFALNMNAKQTDEFFLKAYMDRPFNFKDPEEAIYFFCLQTDRGWPDVQRLSREYHSCSGSLRSGEDVETEYVGYSLSELKTEEELLDFLQTHHYAQEQQNQTAKRRINDLIKRCKGLAKLEYEKYRNPEDSDYKMQKMESLDALLAQITGYDERAMRTQASKEDKAKWKEFNKAIGSNFPERQQLHQIEAGGDVSYDVLFKTLVFLEFYNFYAALLLKRDENSNGQEAACNDMPDFESGFQYTADEFEDKLNNSLLSCGYLGAYERDPYIRMFLFCANTPFPLDTFRNIIYEFSWAEEP